MALIENKIISVKNLLESSLSIPSYQRPYKWTEKNVNQLISDILEHKNKKEKVPYRLGTLIIHKYKDPKKKEDTRDIVDGQQRVVSLTLIAQALKLKKKEKIEKLELKLLTEKFRSNVSQTNIFKNYQLIERRIDEFDDKNIIDFFLGECKLVQVVCDELSEAFQFFDSQNARGKDLEPHDLLKTFHLRAMSRSDKEKRTESIDVVEDWEKMETQELSDLFGKYLYRIRNWSKGRSADEFTKDELDVFKGIDIDDNKSEYPFAELFCKANEAVKYPFQIDQIIINGKRFFEMVEHYKDKKDKLESLEPKPEEGLKPEENGVFGFLRKYDKKDRTGDRYVRNLFECCLLYYYDKFVSECILREDVGKKLTRKAVERIFIWAYSLRLRKRRVYWSAVDNYALGKDDPRKDEPNPAIFQDMREALRPSEIIDMKLNAQVDKGLSYVDPNEKLHGFFSKKGWYESKGRKSNDK